jgi:UDP-glucose:(heptosyl)LPS alpha-1,3-glucosyltransferase
MDTRISNSRIKLRLALAIVSLFPSGGLQRDCLAIARSIKKRGHDVTIFTCRKWGQISDHLSISVLPNYSWTNHGRNLQFAEDLSRVAEGKFDLVVGFDKLPGLDILYCADPPVLPRSGLARLLPRYRAMVGLERANFGEGQSTNLLLLSEPQVKAYRRAWATELQRITLLSPSVDGTRRRPLLRADGTRDRIRSTLDLSVTDWLWISVGSQPKTKGFDRVVRALRYFPGAHLLHTGLRSADRDAAFILRRAESFGVSKRVRLLGHREDIPELMAAADVLVHPSRKDTTGKVILEAIVNGLPVIASEVCGYSDHITSAQAGVVLAEPYRLVELTTALQTACDPDTHARWSANGALYGKNEHLYTGIDQAAEIIIEKGLNKVTGKTITGKLPNSPALKR